MKKKFFSLIKSGSIHLAPKTKILPADEISQLIDGESVLNKIQEDAKQYRLQVIDEGEKIKEQAQAEGYEEGFKNWAEHVAKLEEEIAAVRADMEKLILPVALKAAKKIVGREIELSETAIVDIVANSLKAVSTHKKINVYANKKDIEILERHKPRLKDMFENLEVFSIRERSDIEPGGCIIETEGGIINAQLDNQWRTLEKAFDMILKTKSKG